MRELRTRVIRGTLHVIAQDTAAAHRALELHASTGQHHGFVSWDTNGRAYFKSSDFRGRARLRHTMRMMLWRLPVPRINEYRNLEWLRAHDLRAPRPLAAGVIMHRGMPLAQFLFTEEVLHALPLDALFARCSQDERAGVIAHLARDMARMHDLGFVHHDLYPRNVLVDGDGVWLLDAWRGGPAPQLRGPAYDIACLMLEGTELFKQDEQRDLLARYFAARSMTSRNAASMLARAERVRAALLARLARKPNERRGKPLPSAHWNTRALIDHR